MSAKLDELERLQRLAPVLRKRHAMLNAIREFFTEHDFLEVGTPVRIPAPALEDYIDAEPCGDRFLRTSPELHMKRLLAAGYPRIFQLGPCFRRGESGRRHLPEFAMLEWYRLEADYRDILADTKMLTTHVAQAVVGDTRCAFAGGDVDLAGTWDEISLDQAFASFAGRQLDEAVAAGEFEQVLVESVEPHLGTQRPAVLMDYPSECGGLARCKPDNPARVERWELYVNGLELVNACGELVDVKEQRRRFEACAARRRALGREVYPRDEAFLAALADGVPPCAGAAMGLDRLLMTLSASDDIGDVVAFRD